MTCDKPGTLLSIARNPRESILGPLTTGVSVELFSELLWAWAGVFFFRGAILKGVLEPDWKQVNTPSVYKGLFISSGVISRES